MSYEDSDTFATKLQTIRENYFGVKKSTTVQSVVSDTPVETLNETAVQVDPSIKKYLSAFDKLK